MKIQTNGIEIEFEDSGADGSQADRPVLLLVMGLGMQLTAWPPAMVQALVDAGYRVIRHDNRDIGLSADLRHLGQPNLVWEGLKFNLGMRVRPLYTLHDMAADALGLLDALGVQRAHVLGVSMGGMIAQRMALAAPHRLRSLISVMSTSGATGLPKASAKVQMALLGKPSAPEEEAVVRHYLRLFQLIGSPAFPTPQAELEARTLRSLRRSYRPSGSARQTLAIIADTTRAQALGSIRVPTLVLHGKDDPLVPYAHGVDTARRIPGARLEGLAGMGHDLPPPVVDWIVSKTLPHMAAT